jgi:hypothetical protein
MSKLTELLRQLGADAELAKAYEKNPAKVMEEAGLSKEEITILKKGDLSKLKDATGIANVKLINTIIKAYDD